MSTAHAFVALPTRPLLPHKGSAQPIRAFVRSRDTNDAEVAVFLQTYGITRDYATKRVREKPDGWIEIERVVKNVLTLERLRDEAFKLAAEMRAHFSKIEDVSVH